MLRESDQNYCANGPRGGGQSRKKWQTRKFSAIGEILPGQKVATGCK
jgi:hypothetical protein